MDYAISKGFCCPSCTTKKLEKEYGENAKGIYVRWFGKNQEQSSRGQLDQLYINHDFGTENYEYRKEEIVVILSKYYDVVWDYSNKKTILIKEKGGSKDA